MSDEISNPLLALIRDQGLVDDLQYEEVVGEIKRSSNTVFQILQDFGIMDADTILQAMANHLGAEVISLKGMEIPKTALAAVRAIRPRCIVACRFRWKAARSGSPLRIRSIRPRLMNWGSWPRRTSSWCSRIRRIFRPGSIVLRQESSGGRGQDSRRVGGTKDYGRIPSGGETSDEDLLAGLANEAPIVRFVNLILFRSGEGSGERYSL